MSLLSIKTENINVDIDVFTDRRKHLTKNKVTPLARHNDQQRLHYAFVSEKNK